MEGVGTSTSAAGVAVEQEWQQLEATVLTMGFGHKHRPSLESKH
jgi:hypothetical protein